VKITTESLLSKLYNKWKDGKLTGAAKKLLDKDPELRKSFQDINKANKKALDAICKKYPNLDSCK
tara:strand:- start:14 stop:208 length:195 start_codon:yes stop_codon:yes gene_type:complete